MIIKKNPSLGQGWHGNTEKQIIYQVTKKCAGIRIPTTQFKPNYIQKLCSEALFYFIPSWIYTQDPLKQTKQSNYLTNFRIYSEYRPFFQSSSISGLTGLQQFSCLSVLLMGTCSSHCHLPPPQHILSQAQSRKPASPLPPLLLWTAKFLATASPNTPICNALPGQFSSPKTSLLIKFVSI